VTRAAGLACYMKRVSSSLMHSRLEALRRRSAVARVSMLVIAVSLAVHGLARASQARAQTPGPVDAAHALLAVTDADPLELARVVRRFGDGAILLLLDDAQPIATRIAALRATPWLRQPEDVLAVLARDVASRDAELAQAAARALLAIAQQLDAATLERREHSASALGPVIVGLDALAGQTWIRADLRALVASAAAQLEAAGAPAPHPE
jgi:hypothetical protein